MSYDLSFWKYTKGTNLNDQNVYEQLSDGVHVDGVEDIETSKILLKIKEIFLASGWEQLDELNWESGKGSFQLYTSSQLVRVDCFNMEGEDMNKFIDILLEFECPLFDPQVGERYVDS